jgi:hypothetical protein
VKASSDYVNSAGSVKFKTDLTHFCHPKEDKTTSSNKKFSHPLLTTSAESLQLKIIGCLLCYQPQDFILC